MDLVEEFLSNNWPTYALAELDREDEDGADDVNRLDRRTSVLAKGNRPLKDKALKLLATWLQKRDNQTHGKCGTFRLRRAFILKEIGDYLGALAEAEQLLAADPDSAALNCLVGNLYGSLETQDDYKTAVSFFRKAIKLNDNWSEPRLELLDILFFLGMHDKQCWQQIVSQASTSLNRIDITDRERLILLTYRAVAAVLLDPAYFGSPSYSKDRLEAQNIKIDTEQREDRNVRAIYGIAVREHLSGEDPIKQAARNGLRDFLGETHSKLMPHKKWEDEIRRWEDK